MSIKIQNKLKPRLCFLLIEQRHYVYFIHSSFKYILQTRYNRSFIKSKKNILIKGGRRKNG